MSEIETLGCRHYLAEDEMFTAAAALQRSLHELEDRIHTLASDFHRLLCESGSVPCDVKAFEIVGRIRETVAGLDLEPVEAQAGRVSELKAQVDHLEQEIASVDRPRHLRAVA